MTRRKGEITQGERIPPRAEPVVRPTRLTYRVIAPETWIADWWPALSQITNEANEGQSDH
jgi:hypothetical protein